MVCAILKFATAPLNNMNFFKLSHFDRSGLNFKGIELKILQIVGLMEGYNLCKFRSIACKLRSGQAFLSGENSSALLLRFAILKFATGSSE